MNPAAPNRTVHRPQPGEIVLLGLIAAKHLAAKETDPVGAEAGDRAIARGVEGAGRVATPIARPVNIAVNIRRQPKPAPSIDGIGDAIGVRCGGAGIVIKLIDNRYPEADEGAVEILLHRADAGELIV